MTNQDQSLRQRATSRSAAPLLLLLLAGAATVAFALSGDAGDFTPSDEAARPSSAADAPADPAASQALHRRSEVGASTGPEPSSVRIESDTVFGFVEVRAVVENEGGAVPVESFRWRASGTAMGIEPRGVSDGRVARIRVPVDVPAAVVVDSDGCKQSLPVDVALRGTQFRSVEVRLRPSYETARVTFRCRDEHGAPVRRITLRCEHQPEDAESRREWRTLWTRDSEAPDGVHVLELPVAGWCRFHLTPVDAERLPLRLLPAVREARVADDRRIEEEVVHAVGGTISLAWTDREPMPKGLAGASIRLFDAQGRPVAVNWHKGQSPADGFAIDYMALPCHAAHALPDGSYVVRVQGQDLDVEKRLEVRKGQDTRVVLP